MTTSRPRSRRGAGEELREALIVATSALLDTHQLDDLTVRTVTAATGVSPTALYLHFSDLDALVHEVKKRFFATLGDQLRASDGLHAMAHTYLAYAREHPGHYAVIFHIDKRTDAVGDPPQDVVQAGFAALQPLVDAVGEALGDRPQETFDTAVELWLSLHGRAQLNAAMPWFELPDEDSYVDRLISRIV